MQATHLKLMSLEVHVVTRSRLLPDPEYDSLTSLFFVIATDENCKDVCKKTGRPTQNGSCVKEGKEFSTICFLRFYLIYFFLRLTFSLSLSLSLSTFSLSVFLPSHLPFLFLLPFSSISHILFLKRSVSSQFLHFQFSSSLCFSLLLCVSKLALFLVRFLSHFILFKSCSILVFLFLTFLSNYVPFSFFSFSFFFFLFCSVLIFLSQFPQF